MNGTQTPENRGSANNNENRLRHPIWIGIASSADGSLGCQGRRVALRSEVRANQLALMAALENAVLRGEIGTQREISELRERVTRIEDQLRTPKQ